MLAGNLFVIRLCQSQSRYGYGIINQLEKINSVPHVSNSTLIGPLRALAWG